MNGFAILDLVIGIIFIYFVLSLMCSAIMEVIANFGNLRARRLEQWIRDNFNGKQRAPGHSAKALGDTILRHKLIDGLTRADRKASYIPSSEFASAFYDAIVDEYRKERQTQKGSLSGNTGRENAYTLAEVQEAVQSISEQFLPADFKRVLLQHIAESNQDLIRARKSLEIWYDKAMERLSGGYKKLSQKILLGLGLSIAALLNTDTLVMSRYLYENPSIRTSLAETAAGVVRDPSLRLSVERLRQTTQPDPADKAVLENISRKLTEVDSLNKALLNLQMPLGWQRDPVKRSVLLPQGFSGWLNKIAGILVTGFATALGAPFWFDLLNKLVNLRSVGNRPARSAGRDSNDQTESP